VTLRGGTSSENKRSYNKIKSRRSVWSQSAGSRLPISDGEICLK
jgi:hypothetical protein